MDYFKLKHIKQLGGIIILVLIIIPAATYFTAIYSPLEFSEVVNIISAAGTILLSAVLAYLYLQMWNTQEERTSIHQNQEDILERQVGIQEKQHELHQTEKRSLLDISNHTLTDDNCGVYVSNHGGVAIVESHINTTLSTDEEQFSTKSTQLTRTESDMTKGGKVIGKGQYGVKMRCCPEFYVEINDDQKTDSFSQITTFLVSNDVSSINIEIELVAADEFGNIATNTLLDGEIDIHQNMPLDEIPVQTSS